MGKKKTAKKKPKPKPKPKKNSESKPNSELMMGITPEPHFVHLSNADQQAAINRSHGKRENGPAVDYTPSSSNNELTEDIQFDDNCWHKNGEKNACGNAITSLIHGTKTSPFTDPICNDYIDEDGIQPKHAHKKAKGAKGAKVKGRLFQDNIYTECDDRMTIDTIINNLNKAKLCRNVREQESKQCYSKKPGKNNARSKRRAEGHRKQIQIQDRIINGCDNLAKKKRLEHKEMGMNDYLTKRNKDYNNLLKAHNLISKGNYGKLFKTSSKNSSKEKQTLSEKFMIDEDDDNNYRTDQINKACNTPKKVIEKMSEDAKIITKQINTDLNSHQKKLYEIWEKNGIKNPWEVSERPSSSTKTVKRTQSDIDSTALRVAEAKAKYENDQKMKKAKEAAVAEAAAAAAAKKTNEQIAAEEEAANEQKLMKNTIRYSKKYRRKNNLSNRLFFSNYKPKNEKQKRTKKKK